MLYAQTLMFLCFCRFLRLIAMAAMQTCQHVVELSHDSISTFSGKAVYQEAIGRSPGRPVPFTFN
jgi:hypothetical protein